jgi:hypothetical protein
VPRLTVLPALPARAVRPLSGRLRRWSVESQQGSRRNAMLASTALAARRAERDDVEAFLRAADAGRRAAGAAAVHG